MKPKMLEPALKKGQKLKDKKHAEMIQSWVRNYPNHSYKFEVPFNYFGERGFVDLISDKVNLYSFKTEIVDLGETLRQFNRMTEFYPKYVRVAPSHFTFCLVILHSLENIRFFSQFKEMFDNINVIFFDPENGHKYSPLTDQLCHLGVLEYKGKEKVIFTHKFLEIFATNLVEERKRNAKDPIYSAIAGAILARGEIVREKELIRMMITVGAALNYNGESFEDWWKRLPRSEKHKKV